MTYTATYSPEDNKLRLYASSRLDKETYARVKAAGFSWAPKQELFVAPMWTPQREDLLMELAGEIGDEDTSLVDRAAERADRFEEYRERRSADAAAAHKSVERICDGIPLGQPILVGHHSERHARKDAERIENGMRKAVKMWETARYWQSRAAGAISAAKYKERPDVRARRIKALEADLRSEIASFTPHDGRHIMQTRWNAGGDDKPEPHAFVGPKGRGAHWVPVASLPAIKAQAQRWIQHLENRLVYERAMLAEDGASHLLEPKPRPKQLPLCNYRAPEGLDIENIYRAGEKIHYPQVEMTQAEYSAINVDYKGTRVVDNSHRVRTAMRRSELVCVFLTDSKVHGRPGAIQPEPPVLRERPTYTPRPAHEPTVFEAMKESLKAGVQVVSAPQLFPTPADLAARMVELAEIEPTHRVLEPSAGTGSILKAIGNQPDKVAVEVNPRLVELLSHCGVSGLSIHQGDFLEQNGNLGKFDRILMNPPFENASDIRHIEHALRFLKPRGRLVAICANGSRQQAKLKPMVEKMGGAWEELPEGTFAEAGTGVRTVLLSVDAAPAAQSEMPTIQGGLF